MTRLSGFSKARSMPPSETNVSACCLGSSLSARIMKKYGRPKSVVTDGLCSYPAAMKEVGISGRHEVGALHHLFLDLRRRHAGDRTRVLLAPLQQSPRD